MPVIWLKKRKKKETRKKKEKIILAASESARTNKIGQFSESQMK